LTIWIEAHLEIYKNMAETVTLQIPEALYQRLAIAHLNIIP